MFPNSWSSRSGGESPSCKRQRLMVNGGTTSNSSVDDVSRQKEALPIYAVRWKIISEIRKCSTAIVIGETGSGKTTQIPQYLLAASLQRLGLIGVTQPRRVAAVTIATRVAKEMNCKLGEAVGYTVRFEDVTSVRTKLKYLTDGMLLREAISDPLLRKYSIVILDEAHERTIHTDVLFGIVKAAQFERRMANPLKVIVTSATMDVDHFSRYFNNAPVLYLEGRQFPVQIMYAKEPQEDYVFASLVTIFQIHQDAPPRHDILVFLTGQDEIECTARTVREIAKSLPSGGPQLRVCPLYAALPAHVQLNVFNPTPKGFRKVILSTNLAETSVTIPGVKYVIDTGMVKARSYNPDSGLDLLKVQRTSKAQAFQRSGRAGRDSSGFCYRAYMEREFYDMPEFSIPEIQRCDLSGVVLQMMAIGVDNVMDFDFMDRPSDERIKSAYDMLELLCAIEKLSKYQLTFIGKRMSLFPLDPRFAKILLTSQELNCTDEIVSVIALLSVDSVVIDPQAKREEAAAVRRKFISDQGDQLTLLNIYKSFRDANSNKHWCQENFVHHRNLQMATDIRQQLIELCAKMDANMTSSCGLNMDVVRQCLVSGLFMNSAELQNNGTYLTFDSRQSVHIHPSSCLFNSKPAYVIFTGLVQTTKCYMRNVCVVDPRWLLEAAPTFFKKAKFKLGTVS